VSEAAIAIHEELCFGPPVSTTAVIGVDLALLGALGVCLWATGRTRRALQHARAAVAAGAPLEEGQRVVTGKVELAAGEELAVEVTVTQQGEQRAVKNGHVHEWKEVDRKVSAQPFYVVHESGVRVRVEPPEPGRVELVDRLDQEEWTSRTERRKRAALTAGETAFVEGRLERAHDPEGGTAAGYREAALGWVMRAPPGRKLAVSAEPLEHRHELRLRALEKLFPLLLVGFVVTQAPLLGFWMRAFAGHDVEAAYVRKETYATKDSKGRLTQHYVVDVRVPGEAESRRFEIGGSDYGDIALPPGTAVVRKVGALSFATRLGPGASIGLFSFLAALALGGAFVAKTSAVLRHKRWYERPLAESGSGELPSPPGTRFARTRAPGPPPPKKRRRAS
jgi:hypothetical protein